MRFTVTCVAPSGTAGAKTLTVTNSDASTASSTYTYSDSTVQLGSVSPAGGPLAGGTAITVYGDNFPGTATVRINNVDCTSVVVVDAKTITCVTPSGTSGAKGVVIRDGGSTVAVLTSIYGYTYAAAPSITSDQLGPVVGGKPLALAGSGFQDGAVVSVNGTPLSSAWFGTSSQMRVITPAGSAGAVSLVVTNPDGQSNAAARTLTFNDNPHPISSIQPRQGPPAGGQTCTIYGLQFVTGATATLGSNAVGSPVVRSSTAMSFVAPAGTGSVAVTVTNPDTLTGATSSNAYYQSATVTVTSLSVTTGSTAGGTSTTITGTGFASGSIVVIGGVRATSVVSVNSTTITCVTPANTAGAKDVTVQIPGEALGMLAGGFTYT